MSEGKKEERNDVFEIHGYICEKTGELLIYRTLRNMKVTNSCLIITAMLVDKREDIKGSQLTNL